MSEMDIIKSMVVLLICAAFGSAMTGWLPVKWARRVWGGYSAVCAAGAIGLMVYGIVMG